MWDMFFENIDATNEFLWNYVGVPLILIFGAYLAWVSQLLLLRHAKKIMRIFKNSFSKSDTDEKGISPVRTFFSALSGSIGLENVVSVCTAIQIGGPGAVLWMWIAIGFGMMIKYAEIYLGIIHRVANSGGDGYCGGPMYYLKTLSGTRCLPILFCIMMCIYGTDIYVFRVVTSTLVSQWGLNKIAVIFSFLLIIVLAGARGFDRFGKIASVLIPVFTSTFIVLCVWVFIKQAHEIPHVLYMIVSSAFKGKAVLGAFAGSTMWMAMVEGMKKACYIGDIGIGYASIIHSESTQADPHKEAILGMMAIFISAFFFCTMSVFLILVTGIWQESLPENALVVTALGRHIPYISYAWPVFIGILGYSTLTSYYVVTRKVVVYLFPKWGKRIHMSYVIGAFTLFSFIGSDAHLMTIVSMSGLFLLLINMYGIVRLRKDISFKIE